MNLGNSPHDTILAVPLNDTSPAAQAIQLQVHRAMSGEKRLLMAFEMSVFARELGRARIQQEHPEWSEVQVGRELLRLAFFPEPMPVGLP